MSYLLQTTLLLGLWGLAGPAISEPSKDGFFGFKYSQINWDQHVFDLAGNEIVFNKDDTDALGVELSLPLEGNLKIGGEIQHHEWTVLSDAGNPDYKVHAYANIYLLMAQARYTFNQAGRIRPYVGIGAGYARFSLHSYTNVILEGKTEQINAAVDFMLFGNTGLCLGVMRNHIDVGDRHGNQIDTNATIYQLSLNLHFH